mmetsp:Transcript_10866/g.24218  ORF Transcript_10866/g.24218 Transcript_10866/m.24218 type:complete len:157 (+) Transcript_10866:67-537(+)
MVIHCTRCWSGLLLALLSIGLIACWYIAPRHTLGQLVANRSQLKQGTSSPFSATTTTSTTFAAVALQRLRPCKKVKAWIYITEWIMTYHWTVFFPIVATVKQALNDFGVEVNVTGKAEEVYLGGKKTLTARDIPIIVSIGWHRISLKSDEYAHTLM